MPFVRPVTWYDNPVTELVLTKLPLESDIVTEYDKSGIRPFEDGAIHARFTIPIPAEAVIFRGTLGKSAVIPENVCDAEDPNGFVQKIVKEYTVLSARPLNNTDADRSEYVDTEAPDGSNTVTV
jgi:hypothetical protein